ncbi:MAG: redoxin domain-containing protein [Candidatus Latescibacteria bacterium]|jgi:beta-lactamase regulating signal transducer with metallopeptidase domain/protocatechuate 3,4-dioxygenase beta subunit/peroxiredoxin|nr:redoxin domain-containing protein [Candidatus Latescibacterota bacterium]
MNFTEWLLTLDSTGFFTMRILLSILWQSSILLIAVGILSYILRRKQVSVRYRLWVAATFLIPFLPLLSIVISKAGSLQKELSVIPVYSTPQVEVLHTPVKSQILSESGFQSDRFVEKQSGTLEPFMPLSDQSSQTATVSGNVQAVNRLTITNYPWAVVFVGYMAFAVIFLLWITIGRLRIRSWIVNGDAVMDQNVIDVFQQVSERLSLSREFIIIENKNVPAPMTCRTFRPVIMLPAGFTVNITLNELRAVAVHELSHVKRYDVFILSLLAFIKAVFFFHPLVWLAVRQVSYLAELACDSEVVDYTKESVSYAELLTRIADNLQGRTLSTELAVGIVFSKSIFFHRIKTILSDRRDRIRMLSRWSLLGTVTAAVLSLIVALALPLGYARETGDMITISGKVLHNNNPVSEAQIYFNDFIGRTTEKVTKSDKDGFYSFDVEKARMVDGGYYNSYSAVIAFKKNIAPGWKMIRNEIAFDDFNIVLNEPIHIRGSVFDTSQNPVSNAEVSIGSLGIELREYIVIQNALPFLMTKTDKNGHFLLQNIPAGSGGVVVAKKSGFSESHEYLGPMGAKEVQITINRGSNIEGNVCYSESGKPARNVKIIAKNASPLYYNYEVWTDRKGNFKFDNLASDNYTLYAVVDGDPPEWTAHKIKDVIVKEGETTRGIEINLIKGGLVTGSITDIDTGEPIPDHFVSYNDPDFEHYNRIAYTITNMQGTFIFRLPPGKISIVTSKPNGYIYPEWWEQGTAVDDFQIKLDVEVLDDGIVTVDRFAFSKGLILHGRTLTNDGTPVDGVELTYGRGFKEKSVFSDDKGLFVISGLKEGEQLKLQVNQSEKKLRGKIDVEVSPDAEVDIQLEHYETASISGRLLDDDGNPIPHGKIMIHWFGDGIDLREGRVQDNTLISSEDGTFTFDGLIAGDKYFLMPEADGFITDRRLYPDKMFTAQKHMPPLEDLVLERKGTRWIEGRVIDQDGKPVVGARIKTTTTDAEGIFRLDEITGVTLRRLQIHHKDFGMFFFSYIPTNRQHSFTLIEGKNRLSGKILDTEGNPITNARVDIDPTFHPSGKNRRRVEVDENGIFTYEKVIEDKLNLGVYVEEKGYKRFNDIKTGENEVVLVFDKPDESNKSEWGFNPQQPVVLEGTSAPAFEVKKWINGSSVNISELKGKIVVLDFFTKEEPWQSNYSSIYKKTRFIQSLHEEYNTDEVVCIGIHEHDVNENVLKKVIEQYGLTYPIAVDTMSSVSGSKGKTFDVYGMNKRQLYILINRDGKVQPDLRFEELEKKIRELIKK